MPAPSDEPSQPATGPGTDPVADRYRFWTTATAVQLRRGRHSREEMSQRVVRCFKDLCEVVQPTLVLELGAHQAAFSRWARKAFPGARCLALEANPYVHAKHERRLARAGVDYLHAAATDTSGTITLKIPTEVHGRARSRTNRMASLATHRASGGHEEVEVRAVRVDDLVQPGPDDRVVAWIDVEGASAQVLTGARVAMARADAVYIEVESTPTWDGQWLDVDVARFLEDLGKVPVLRDHERPHQHNVVFLDHALAARPDVARRVGRVLAAPKG